MLSEGLLMGNEEYSEGLQNIDLQLLKLEQAANKQGQKETRKSSSPTGQNVVIVPEEAQQVIINMTFNMGAPRLSKFKKFIAGVNAGDWNTAAVEMMDSRWAKQVGNRAIRLRDRIQALA